jgi:hypothetical protein
LPLNKIWIQFGQKKPWTRQGLKPFLLSHIKAPLREEKREAANCPNQIYQKAAEIDPNSRQNRGDLSILDGNQAA